MQSYIDPGQGGDPATPLKFFALDLWNGSAIQCEAFRSNAGISYPCLMQAGTNGIGLSYDTSWDAFFVIDGEGTIRYRRVNSQGPPTWRPDEVGLIVDQALAELAVPVREAPAPGFALAAPFPNPFNPTTTIRYRLAGTGGEVSVGLRILDLRGRVVRTLVTGRQATGRTYETSWDGRNNAGNTMSSGTYLVDLTVDGRSRVRFITLVK